MRRVLLISPHFPPDATAGTHRVRLLAPYLSQYGWEPTVLTCEPEAYEGTIDPSLAALVPSSLRVIRVPVLSARMTRRAGIGDLGLRSFPGLYREAARLLRTEPFEALFITIFPAYTALIGPPLVRRFGIPFVLDYQDPWVNAWGVEVGGGREGRVDLKSRASRFLAEWLEPRAVRAASAITGVSEGTYAPILERNRGIRPITEAIPIGAEPGDFSGALDGPSDRAPLFDPADGRVHVCAVGTILPHGGETLAAVLSAAVRLRETHPALYAKLRLHFIGTSNQTTPTDERRVMPVAERLGVADIIHETPTRIPYSAAVRLQQQATALLAMGSTERHYTASKIFPSLLAKRPLLAVYHEASSVVDILASAARQPSVSLVTYSDSVRAGAKVDEIAVALASIVERPVWNASDVHLDAFSEYFAATLAGRLANVLDRVVEARAA